MKYRNKKHCKKKGKLCAQNLTFSFSFLSLALVLSPVNQTEYKATNWSSAIEIIYAIASIAFCHLSRALGLQ